MRRSRQAWIPILAAVLAFTAYMANGRWIGAIDNFTTRYVPLSVVREGNTDLDEFPGLLKADPMRVSQASDGHYYSRVPQTTVYLAVPVYWVAEILGLGPQTSLDLCQTAKLTAAVISALCVGVMALALSRFVWGWRLWLLCAAYALGSPMWPVASQDLWVLTSAQFFSVLTIYCLVRGLSQPNWTLAAIAPLGLAFLSRPQQSVAVIPIALYMFLYYRRQFYWTLLLSSPIILLFLLFRTSSSGSFYNDLAATGMAGLFRFDPGYLLHVLIRQLFDLSHGVIVYSPYVLFTVLGLGILLRGSRQPSNQTSEKGHQRLLLLSGIISVAYLLLYSCFVHWRGGWSLTNRYYLDATPYVIMLLIPVVRYRPMPKPLLGGLVSLVALAVLVNGLVAFYADLEWLSFYLLGDGHETQDYTLKQSLFFYVGRKALGLGDGPILDRDGSLLSPEPYRANGNLIPVTPIEEPSATIHLRSGWCYPENFGVWACFGSNHPISPIGPPFAKDRAVLAVHLDPGRDYGLRIKAQPYCDETHQTQSMRVTYNGHDVGDFSLPCRGYWASYTLEASIQSDWISDHVDRLEFAYSSFYEGDLANATRRLAIAFTEVTFSPRASGKETGPVPEPVETSESHRRGARASLFYFLPTIRK